MLISDDRRAIETIENASTAVLTLAEGLEQTELLASRLTRYEIRRELLNVCEAHAVLSARAREAMAELDFAGWVNIGQRIREGGESEVNASWLALWAMAPTALGWIRFYRSQKPELFSLQKESPPPLEPPRNEECTQASAAHESATRSEDHGDVHPLLRAYR